MPFFGVGGQGFRERRDERDRRVSVRGTVAPRRLPWRMTMGSFPAAGEQIEAAFREQLLLRHFQDGRVARRVVSCRRRCPPPFLVAGHA